MGKKSHSKDCYKVGDLEYSEQMAYELKNLTGVLLLRNKFLIIFYRGKDFLPQGVANLVDKREMALRRWQLNETFQVADEPLAKSSTVGTLSEFHDIQMKFGDLKKENNELELQLETQKENLERELRNEECELSILNIKIEKSAKELAKLNSSWQPAELDVDSEIIIEEERECLWKIGLKLNSCLVLGRCGVFNGVIGVHQHWKHREVIKVITMQRVFIRVIYTAKLLVAESVGFWFQLRS